MIAGKIWADIATCLQRKNTGSDPQSISILLDDYLGSAEQNNTLSRRFNPSSLSYLCPVERAYRIEDQNWDKGGEPKPVTVIRQGVIGTAIHSAYQNSLLPQLGKYLWGKWRCTNCKTERWGFRPEPCSGYSVANDTVYDCTGAVKEDISFGSWHYVELYFQYKKIDPTNENYWITGYSDGIWVDATIGKWFVLELKTKGELVFNGLRSRKGKSEGVEFELVIDTFTQLPTADQVHQGQMYIPLINDAVEKGDMPAPPGVCGGVIIGNINRNDGLDKFDHIPYDSDHFDTEVTRIKAIKEAETPTVLQRKCPKDTSRLRKALSLRI
jgi:hypothetical protein